MIRLQSFSHKMPIILLWVIGISFFIHGSAQQRQEAFSEKMPLAARSLLLSISHAGYYLVAVGERGHVLVTSDCGKHWEQVIVPTRALLTSVFFVNARDGWAVGHDSVILRSEDSGTSWQKVYQDTRLEKPLLDVWFENPKHGIAVGAYGLFLETHDGGKTWKERSISQDDFHLYSISAIPGKAWFIAGESGSVYRSVDKGKSWTRLSLSYQGTFFGSLAVQHGRLLVFGMRGRVFASDDLGENWKSIDTGVVNALESGLQNAGKEILITGHDGIILRSQDNGDSFSIHKIPGRKHIAQIAQCNASRIIVGEGGVREVRP